MDVNLNPNLYLLTDRVGHVSVQYEDQLLIVWGGYDRNKPEEHSYYDPSLIAIFNSVTGQIQTHKSTGDVPPQTCGAAAVVHAKDMYVIGGFITSNGVIDNTSDIYKLNVSTKIWTKLTPEMEKGRPPLLKVDKLSAWCYRDEIFIFGGYGPVPTTEHDHYPSYFTHILDPEYLRGWTNQQLAINTKNNTVRWLNSHGDIPCARAAHATVCDPIRKCVYLFGGRFGTERLNDLYIGDLSLIGEIAWKKVEKRHGEAWPCGRSWHTISTIGPDAILLYGGYDSRRKPLNDCWLFNTSDQTWQKLNHQAKECRLWHTAHFVKALDSVYLLGGVRHDILSTATDMHPVCLDRLQLSPLSLVETTLQIVMKNPAVFRKYLTSLPYNIQMQIMKFQTTYGS